VGVVEACEGQAKSKERGALAKAAAKAKASSLSMRRTLTQPSPQHTQQPHKTQAQLRSKETVTFPKQPAMPPPGFIILALILLPLATPSQMVTYKLQHAFGLTAPFQDRGTIEILVDSGALTLIPPPEDQPVLVPEGSFDEIAREMRLPDGGLYRLRAQRDDASAPVIMTSVRLCDVVRAGFRENITLMLDVEGRLLGLEYTPRMSVLSPTTCLAMKSPLDQVHRDSDGKKKEVAADTTPAAFSTLIKAAVDQAGQSPPVVVPGQRPPMIQIRYDEQERQPEVQKSFLQKYVRTQRRREREMRFVVMEIVLF